MNAYSRIFVHLYQVIQLGGPTTFSDEGYFTKSEIDEKSQNFLDFGYFLKN